MSRNKGTFNFAANLEGVLEAPIDARQLVQFHADLINPTTWEDLIDGSVWLYNGAIVAVGEDPDTAKRGIYYLVDADNYTDEESWIKVGDDVTPPEGVITGATNGLSKIERDVELGGDLTKNTSINGQNNDLNFNNLTNFNVSANTINLKGQVEIEDTPPEGNVPGDWVLVRNLVDKGVKHVDTVELTDIPQTNTINVVTENTTLTDVYDTVFVNATSSITITLPAEPLDGQIYKIKDVSGNAYINVITVDGNGKMIEGSSSNGVINTSYGAVELTFSHIMDGWYITNINI